MKHFGFKSPVLHSKLVQKKSQVAPQPAVAVAAGFVPDGATIPEPKAEDATAEPKGKEPEHIYEIYVPRGEDTGSVEGKSEVRGKSSQVKKNKSSSGKTMNKVSIKWMDVQFL